MNGPDDLLLLSCVLIGIGTAATAFPKGTSLRWLKALGVFWLVYMPGGIAVQAFGAFGLTASGAAAAGIRMWLRRRRPIALASPSDSPQAG